jgi:PEP-CTERM motif-containing protein
MATATSSATSGGSGKVSSISSATGGAGGTGNHSTGGSFGGNGGAGGDANASSSATSSGSGNVSASASATGGAGGEVSTNNLNGANTIAGHGPSGSASAQSMAQNAGGSVTTMARSLAAAASLTGGAAGAMTMAAVGAGAATLVPIAAGETVSDASVTPGGPAIGVGAMSAGYGGSGETLTYETSADFGFAAAAPEELFLTLLDNNALGRGFDKLKFEVTVDGTIAVLDTFTSLRVAAAFFSDNTLDLGPLSAGDENVDISALLTASEPGAGFGFDYALTDNPTVPEPSTWAMMLIGFVGLDFASRRRTRTRSCASGRRTTSLWGALLAGRRGGARLTGASAFFP